MGKAITIGRPPHLSGLGLVVNSPDFNPVDWYHAAVDLLTAGPGGATNSTNILDGTLSQNQKTQIIAAEAQANITAGADPTTAIQQATSDVTKVLLANNADPSQGGIPTWVYLAGGGALLLLLLLRR